jgi:ferric-dicitrate binding protein FerR (iron transport regulator)
VSCLSDRAIERAVAGLASVEQRAHLGACLMCAARHRRVASDLRALARVLATGAAPRPRRRPARWGVAAAAGCALAAAALLSLHPGAWPGREASRDAGQQQVAMALADISSALFSLHGEPGAADDDEALAVCRADGAGDASCADADDRAVD